MVVPVEDAEDADDVSARLWAHATTGIAETVDAGRRVLQAAFEERDQAERARAALGRPAAITSADDDGWVETWRQASSPTVVEGIVVRSPWHPATAAGRREVVIDPGATFGHGGHPTTRLALSAVVRSVGPATSVLDVGCGSGVLAVTAATLGAAPVVAVDIDAASVAATAANAVRNGVLVDVRLGTVDPGLGEFDVVVANVLAATLRQLATRLVHAVAPGGRLVVAGLLAEQRAEVEGALAPLRTTAVAAEGDWVGLTLQWATPTA